MNNIASKTQLKNIKKKTMLSKTQPKKHAYQDVNLKHDIKDLIQCQCIHDQTRTIQWRPLET